MSDRDAILESLGLIRRRWRLRLLLDGLGRFVLALIGAMLLWTLVIRSGLGEGGVGGARVAIWLALTLGLVLFLWRGLRARADERTVALYLEEHEPSLRQAVMSAVHSLDGDPAPDQSPALVERLLQTARQALAGVDGGRRVEAARLRRASGTLTVSTLGAAALLVFGPTSLKTSARSLFDPTREVALPAPFSVVVDPGNATIPRGGAQVVEARLAGFTSDLVELVFRADSAAEWQRIPMEGDSLGGRFLSRLFDVVKPTEYFVEAQGVRSALYRLDVVDLPTVSGLSALIRYPAYTGLPAESIEEAGDLAVLRGSTVTIRATTTRPARAAYLALRGAEPIPMRRDPDGRFSARFRVSGDGFYRIELEADDGRRLAGSLEFAIDALEDAAPTVRFSAPGRDTKVTSVEEVTAQIEATDDFGVREVTLHLSVNGGAERVVTVMDSTVTPRGEVSAAHTFFLEEWSLVPGDVVSYFARAKDGAGQEASSDIYFLEVRPFDKTYREAEQGGMPGGGESAEGLSERQRQIVVGTFNVIRDSSEQTDRVWRENVTTLAIGEGRLREDVTNLVTRMRQRRLTAEDSTFALIATALDSALVSIGRAEEQLGQRRPRTALPDEQRALQHLQRAEAAYREVQVSRGQQGGGGNPSSAEELADLFELETDKLRNQYESVQRESAAEAERRVDETLERLRRLASRQQQENERMERMAQAMRNRSSQAGGGGGGGGGSQRDLAQETEEAARQLERLARERNDAALGESARRLREAAEAMRRAASAGAQQGAAQGTQALERLRDATRQLEQARAEGRRDELRRLQSRAQELERKQQEIAAQATSLPRDPAARIQRSTSLGERKDALAREVEQLESAAERLARDAARDQPRAARKVAEAAEGLRENRVRDKILFSKSLLRGGSEDYIRSFEEQIGDNLAQAAEQLGAAAGELGEASGSREERALERARDLVRGLESLRDRARAAQGPGREGEPGEQGANAQGREGRQGQEQAGGQSQGGGQQGREQGQAGGQGAENRLGGANRGFPEGGGSGRMDPGTARQFAREFRSRQQAAESLRGDLQRLGEDVSELNRLLGRFRALDDPRTFGDVQGLERLEQDLIEGLKNLEFSLWRKFGAEGTQRPALGASARVPPQYREQVEEYYRSLARRKARDR
jgi:hypothetical protein